MQKETLSEHAKAAKNLLLKFKRFREELSPGERRMIASWLAFGRLNFGGTHDAPFTPLQVVYPPTYPSGTVDYAINQTSKQIEITIEFLGSVDINSLKPQMTCILSTSVNPNAALGPPIQMPANNGGTTAVKFTSRDAFDALLTPRPDASFTFRLIGTNVGQGIVTDDNGHALDGDGDGVPGGDYLMVFTLIG